MNPEYLVYLLHGEGKQFQELVVAQLHCRSEENKVKYLISIKKKDKFFTYSRLLSQTPKVVSQVVSVPIHVCIPTGGGVDESSNDSDSNFQIKSPAIASSGKN